MPVNSLNTGEVARYVHASVHNFNPIAVRDAVKHLAWRTIASPNTWSLEYDTTHEAFVLACHNADGRELNERLQDVLEQMVVDELNAAESLKREPYIARSEKYCTFVDIDYAGHDTSSDIDSATSERHDRSEIVSHVVSTKGLGFNGKLKAMRISGLPLALQMRTRHPARPSKIRDSVSIRLVRWDENSQEHIFNARAGEPLQPMTHDQSMDCEYILEVAYFKPMERSTIIRKQLTSTIDDPPETGTREWEFEGEQPSVQQWLAGTGKTRRVDCLPPDAEPEPSRDAVKFTGGTLEYPVVGRLRIPKGVPMSTLREDDEEQALDKTEMQLNNDFTQLMKRTADDDDDSLEGDDQSTASSHSEDRKPSTFAALMKGIDHIQRTTSESAMVMRPAMPVVTSEEPPPRPIPQTISDETESGPPPTTQNTTVSNDSFPTYNRRYFKVDGIGLSGHAANQALWEHENNRPPNSNVSMRTSKTGQQLQREREAMATNSVVGSATMSIVDGRELYIGEKGEDAVSTTPLSYGDTKLGGDEWWARNVVPQIQFNPSGNLVDISGDGEQTTAPAFTTGRFPSLVSAHERSSRPPPALANTPHNGAMIPSSEPPPGFANGAHGAGIIPISTQQPGYEVLPGASTRSTPPRQAQPLASVPPGASFRSFQAIAEQVREQPTVRLPSGGVSRSVLSPKHRVYGSEPPSVEAHTAYSSARVMENLIDLDTPESWPNLENPRPTVKLPQRAATKHKTLGITAPTQVHAGAEDLARVVERLRPASEDKAPKLHGTMHQKAQKKGKRKNAGKGKANSVPAKTMAVLELPDQPPPPKTKNDPEQSTTKKSPATIARIVNSARSPDVLHRRLTEMLSTCLCGDPKVVVRFGMILMDATTDLTTAKAAKVHEIQALLDDMRTETDSGSVQFLSVLAREFVDVAYLLQVPAMLVPAVFAHQDSPSFAFFDQGEYALDVQVVYQIEIIDTENTPWIVMVDQEDLETPNVMPATKNGRYICVHCPLSVWDAQVQIEEKQHEVNQANTELVQALTTFIKTFHGPGGSLGFEADIPEIDGSPAFSVTKIFAKRLFTQHLPLHLETEDLHPPFETKFAAPHAVWHVDQVWDLLVSCGDGRKGEPSITAFAIEQESMKAEGRLWFEASLHLDEGLEDVHGDRPAGKNIVGPAKMLQELEVIINRIVEGLDCVGLGGLHAMDQAELMRVPQQPRKAVKRRKSVKEPDYVPYW